MRPLEPDILEHLKPTCDGEPIHFVGLGIYDFQVGYSSVRRIQTTAKVVCSLQGQTFAWEEGPSNMPVWLLVGQTPSSFELTSPYALRMNLASGDWVEFYCDDSPYEALIIDFGIKDGAIVMEIY